MLVQHEHVGQPGKAGAVGDEAGESRLLTVGANSPNTSEFSIARSTLSRAMFGDQYAMRRNVQIASRSSRLRSVEMR